MFPFLNLGPLALPTKPFLIIIGLYGALWLVEKTAARLTLDPEAAYDWLFKSVVAGFIGARLVFVIDHWEIYLRNPIGIVWPLTAGFTVWAGGLAAAAIWLYVGQRKQHNLWLGFDSLLPSILFFFITFRLGDWLGGPGYGSPTTLFGLTRHWVQLYDVIVALIAFAVWWIVFPQREWPGRLGLITTAVLSFGLLFTLPFRGDPWLIGNGWHGSQLITLSITAICLALLAYLTDQQTAEKAPPPNEN